MKSFIFRIIAAAIAVTALPFALMLGLIIGNTDMQEISILDETTGRRLTTDAVRFEGDIYLPISAIERISGHALPEGMSSKHYGGEEYISMTEASSVGRIAYTWPEETQALR